MERNQWLPWIELVKKGLVEETIYSVSQEYRPVVAAALSVARWDPRTNVDTTGWDGLCYLYNEDLSDTCKGCPLFCFGQECWNINSVLHGVDDFDGDDMLSRIMLKTRIKAIYRLMMKVYKMEREKILIDVG